jgi:hypothetical protein
MGGVGFGDFLDLGLLFLNTILWRFIVDLGELGCQFLWRTLVEVSFYV